MVEDLSEFSAGEFQTVSELLASDPDLQLLMILLGIGLLILTMIYRSFGKWMYGKKFSYTRPHAARFTRSALLAFFAIVLVTSINVFVQWSELDAVNPSSVEALETFAKILNTINILVVAVSYTHLTLPTIYSV